MLKNINDNSFNDIDKTGVIIIDFWANWCGPCRIMGPIMEEVASRWTGTDVRFYKMDIDESQNTSNSFGIRSIPTILILKNGEIEDQIIGTTPAIQIDEKIRSIVEPKKNIKGF